MTRSTRRGPWLPEEDATLLQLIRSQGPNNWVRISQQMEQRSPKQCRERYHQNLKASLNHEPISPQEGELIEQLVHEMGKRWAEIARRLGNRSDNAVKNWWNGSMNRRKRNNVHQISHSRVVGHRAQPIPATRPSRNGYLHDPTPYSAHIPETSHDYGRITDYSPDRHYRDHVQDRHFSPLPQFSQPLFSAISSRPSADPFISRLSPPPSAASLPRPAFLNASGSYASHWSLPRPNVEAPMISPAATEYSNAPSLQHAPSLISDNQSSCSISPKTVPSPRPGLHITTDISAHSWFERRDSVMSMPKLQDEGYMSASQSASLEHKHKLAPLTLEPVLSRTLPQPGSLFSPSFHAGKTLSSPISPNTERDNRMNVSRLLE